MRWKALSSNHPETLFHNDKLICGYPGDFFLPSAGPPNLEIGGHFVSQAVV